MEVRITGPLARDMQLKQEAAVKVKEEMAAKIREEAEAQGYDTSELSDAELLELGLGDLWKKAKKKVSDLFEERTTTKVTVINPGGKDVTYKEVKKGGKVVEPEHIVEDKPKKESNSKKKESLSDKVKNLFKEKTTIRVTSIDPKTGKPVTTETVEQDGKVSPERVVPTDKKTSSKFKEIDHPRKSDGRFKNK